MVRSALGIDRIAVLVERLVIRNLLGRGLHSRRMLGVARTLGRLRMGVLDDAIRGRSSVGGGRRSEAFAPHPASGITRLVERDAELLEEIHRGLRSLDDTLAFHSASTALGHLLPARDLDPVELGLRFARRSPIICSRIVFQLRSLPDSSVAESSIESARPSWLAPAPAPRLGAPLQTAAAAAGALSPLEARV